MSRLKFNGNKKFKIMQITDTQEIPKVSPDTIKLIDAALEKAKPDLVIFTGDQIKGYSAKFRGKNGEAKVRLCIEALLGPVIRRGIHYAITFGNHDYHPMSEKEQMKIYRESNLCLNTETSSIEKPGTFNIPIYQDDSSKPVFNIYVIHSGRDAKGGGYDPVDTDVIDWYKRTRDGLMEESGSYVPSLVFQHIPVPEYYDILKQVDKNCKGAVRAYRTHKNQYYILDESTVADGGFMNETPAIPDINTGEFEAITEKGDVIGIYVGHDHINSFSCKSDGIDLGYTQGSGFNVYGPSIDRGVRIFELDQNSPREYKTYTLTFKELVGTKVKRPLKNYIYAHAPTTIDAAIPLVVKGLLILGAVVSGLVFLFNTLR